MLRKSKNESEKMIIGYYNKSVFITYLGVISGTVGMYFAYFHHITYALICLIFSGICDAFDGKIARKCKRTSNEKYFGIQIDSLADMVSFIFLPIVIFYGLGFTSWYNILIFALFTLGGVIRLGYFNVIAEEKAVNNPVSYYSGLPVTASAAIFPLVYFLVNFTTTLEFKMIYSITMLFVACLYVLNFKVKKPDAKTIYIFVIGGAALIAALYLLK